MDERKDRQLAYIQKKNFNTGRPLCNKTVFCMYSESKITSPQNHLLNYSHCVFTETVMMEQTLEAVECVDSIRHNKDKNENSCLMIK